MFHPTQCWLFRPIGSLALKIHQPLPLNPREAKQLLNLITTSFRQQLAREHGLYEIEAGNNDKAASLPPSKSPSPTTRRWNPQSKENGRDYTDRHLYSMLTNPLLSHSRKKLQGGTESSRDPMEVFDDACARGLMTVEYAEACLAAKKRMIQQSLALSVRDAMKSSGAGLKVLRWLVSSGKANEATFPEVLTLSNSTTLVQFLVAEELQEAIWVWLDRLFLTISKDPSSGTASPAAKAAAWLLLNLVKEEVAEYGSLDVAFGYFEKAHQRLLDLKCPARPIVAGAGYFLCFEISLKSSSHPPPSPAAYESFLRLAPMFTSPNGVNIPQLLLHHPTKPHAEQALKFLKRVEAEQDMPRCSKGYPPSRIISLGLDTAKHLLEREQHEDARWVMEFLQKFYAKPLGLDHKKLLNQKKLLDQAQAEASSLELLDSLNLA